MLNTVCGSLGRPHNCKEMHHCVREPVCGQEEKETSSFPLFACPFHQVHTSLAREESPVPAMSQTPSSSFVTRRQRNKDIATQDTTPGEPHPAALPPADGSVHSVKLAVSPETATMLDLPQCLSWLFSITSFFPEFISFVLLFLSQHLLLYYTI